MRPLAQLAGIHHSFSDSRTWQRVQEGQPVNSKPAVVQYRDRTTLTTEGLSWVLRPWRVLARQGFLRHNLITKLLVMA